MEPRSKVLELFMHNKPVGIIMSLRESGGKYASVLSKETDCTYTHTLKILTQMKDLGLVEFEKKGRIKFVKLTSKGLEAAAEIDSLVKKLEGLTEGKKAKKKKNR